MSELEVVKAQLELLLSHVEEGVHIVDHRGVTVYYNRAASRIEGLSPSEVLGRHLLDIFPSLSEENSTILKVLKTGEPIYDQEQTFTNYKGRKITTINTTLPVKVNGKVTGAMEISRDVTSVRDMSERITDLQAILYGRQENADIKENGTSGYTFDDIVGRSEAIVELKKLAIKAAKSSIPVLVWGETGTGKELFVQAIHNESPRKNKPFISQNCAALPGALLEGTLFGTIKGGFAGAEDRPGLFELADGGTIFLDEIDTMPLELQAKLLRVLQEGAIRRLGDTKVRFVDTRVITSCSEDPVEAVRKQKLREDLFYRINVVSLRIPPLRERREDIPLLVDHFIKKYSQKEDREVRVSDEVMKIFLDYPWPGNVRELENAIEGALVLMEGNEIKPVHLPIQIKVHFSPQKGRIACYEDLNLNDALERVEADLIKKALEKSEGNISKAARMLGVPRQTLQYKLRKLKVEEDGFSRN
ncbi:sigma-54 interaction domain-containing protein [Thermosediminibacter oceani]|uniref:PAS modulated sigma54 specific transcriptional regulator, Fis family n=1 Tax=Thermosediminibacter oceani (strain ATCC BAA-1034 / DSM 16646 / JW/IW-1228P) TaxID=555079 RepID=D9S0N7_THEOJ|nr:sigma-54-dependent Fis family transcriptional regulator [Thermosediminibacter oceani]ADL08895.1 PAS modulated sigma54 specific transcriptional regulator, Fis family [Thermosediminibacter oceani DSM 16646]